MINVVRNKDEETKYIHPFSQTIPKSIPLQRDSIKKYLTADIRVQGQVQFPIKQKASLNMKPQP